MSRRATGLFPPAPSPGHPNSHCNSVCDRRRGTAGPRPRQWSVGQPATETTFTIATNEFRGGGGAERTEYHPCVAWGPLGPHLLGVGSIV